MAFSVSVPNPSAAAREAEGHRQVRFPSCLLPHFPLHFSPSFLYFLYFTLFCPVLLYFLCAEPSRPAHEREALAALAQGGSQTAQEARLSHCPRCSPLHHQARDGSFAVPLLRASWAGGAEGPRDRPLLLRRSGPGHFFSYNWGVRSINPF